MRSPGRTSSDFLLPSTSSRLPSQGVSLLHGALSQWQGVGGGRTGGDVRGVALSRVNALRGER